MKRGGKLEICVLVGVLFGAGAQAATEDTSNKPYGAIVERNVFNLHAPPPPLNPADLIKKTPPPKITLTGITTILGMKKTFLTTPPTKPGSPPESIGLAEGQAQNDIEVKSIDEKAGVVQVINHGEPQTLDFEHDGAKTPGPPSGPPPGVTSFPPPMLPPPAALPIPQPNNIPRPLRSLQGRQFQGNESNNGGGMNGGAFGGGMNGANVNQQSSQVTPEEQVALIEIQREKFRQQNDPTGSLLPPTEMSPGSPGNPAPQ
jgi:hypothetical protein